MTYEHGRVPYLIWQMTCPPKNAILARDTEILSITGSRWYNSSVFMVHVSKGIYLDKKANYNFQGNILSYFFQWLRSHSTKVKFYQVCIYKCSPNKVWCIFNELQLDIFTHLSYDLFKCATDESHTK